MVYTMDVIDVSALLRVKNDIKPDLLLQILNEDTMEAKDLTGYSLTFTMRMLSAQIPKVKEQPFTITDAAAGKIRYRFKTAEVDEYGEFVGEIAMYDNQGNRQTIYDTLRIQIRNNYL